MEKFDYELYSMEKCIEHQHACIINCAYVCTWLCICVYAGNTHTIIYIAMNTDLVIHYNVNKYIQVQI